MKEPRGQALIKRYAANYGIPACSAITEKAILEHWELEESLRVELLEATPGDRWKVFDACYSRLYCELDWLNQFAHSDGDESHDAAYRHWRHLVGSPPMKVYEIVSGKGALVSYLARCGFERKAPEITQERGAKWAAANPNLVWDISDGVHLARFEPTDFYDVAISNHVVERLHPDDLLDHFKGVHSTLAHDGRYVSSTPHASVGPSDVSRVFERDTPMGMHLEEYTCGEIKHLLRLAGFEQVNAPVRFPKRLGKLPRAWLKPKSSESYMVYLCFVEKLIARIPTQKSRRKIAETSRLFLFAPNLMVVAKKALDPTHQRSIPQSCS